jgi:hypothetical protein
MTVSGKETRTSRELEQMIADLSGLRTKVVAVHKIGREGNFGATVVTGIGQASSGAQQSNIEAICDRLRLKYRLRD